jgi:hypothetical protein
MKSIKTKELVHVGGKGSGMVPHRTKSYQYSKGREPKVVAKGMRGIATQEYIHGGRAGKVSRGLYPSI